ncbi:phosphopantetheine-binding protein [Fischerella sp. JS2]|uniref:phosphopantetheine-binding protein n=1 Tax=Fischerella sp. JS2 TaxID=2597771 RepID=UPI0028EC58E7|nr:phosphopantetheine-binding protein [Fischerella sp. JS2]
MVLQQGFERFEDRELRSEHPVLSKEQWRKILASLEFTDSVFMNQPGSVADLIGFDVFVAQAPATVQRFKPKQLRDFLGEKLPEYMLPAEFVLLDALPLTANGKVDRRALPGLQGLRCLTTSRYASTQVKAAYVMPQTETEKIIANIWQEVLQIEKVGINDNFFELGGDSLQVTQVVSRVHEKFQLNVPMQSLLQTPTLASLAKSIDEINITAQIQAPIDKALTNRVEIEL